jgi:ABC-2 type transport system permease protein
MKESDREAGAHRGLRQARWHMLVNGIFQSGKAAQFRVMVIVGVSLFFWMMVFAFFYESFLFLGRTQLINQALAEFLFRMFFASLLVMLFFSSGILLFGGLFASDETSQLLAGPTPPDHIFAFKFQESMFFSSWGFMLLGSPMTLAYALHSHAPIHFHLFALLFFAAFVFLPASFGALGCLLVARFAPRRRLHVLMFLAAVVLVVIGRAGWSLWQRSQGIELNRSWLSSAIQDMQAIDLLLLPSQWITRGLLAASFHEPSGPTTALYYLVLLAGHSGLAYLVTAWAFRKLYRSAYDHTHSAGEVSVYPRVRFAAPKILARFFSPTSRPMQALIHKDLVTFVRDPLQWSQVLIFAGLLLFYFIALGRMNYYLSNPYWKNLIGFFNMGVTGLILSTFTSRFVFPLISLELQKFWILQLSPISRKSILWSKFRFAAIGSALVTISLTLIGAISLRLDPLMILIQLMAVFLLCLGLSGIAVGLGARFPDLKESDPSRIAAGFGGTLNLVASLAYLAIVVGALAVPCHFYSLSLAAGPSNAGDLPIGLSAEDWTPGLFQFWMSIGMIIAAVACMVATWIPMKVGIRALRRWEW